MARAKLEMRKNELLPRVEAEKNSLALQQAEARFTQLRTTFGLKRVAAEADLRILEIGASAPNAHSNTPNRMLSDGSSSALRGPGGDQTTFRNSGMVEIVQVTKCARHSHHRYCRYLGDAGPGARQPIRYGSWPLVNRHSCDSTGFQS